MLMKIHPKKALHAFFRNNSKKLQGFMDNRKHYLIRYSNIKRIKNIGVIIFSK